MYRVHRVRYIVMCMHMDMRCSAPPSCRPTTHPATPNCGSLRALNQHCIATSPLCSWTCLSTNRRAVLKLRPQCDRRGRAVETSALAVAVATALASYLSF
ncbi:hypothetical protein M441DRAFT_353078 [Trichoderma asperellum CBS 433.97]|uniref:Uncharacterized protein n=1 Tax=Trichoderma asperellum (strain ATCC 204424 / CBS 433.97 / NBRC 101777) TaxID=1042311 RepID=A0A2T3ZIL2_TRIA4|nr:hypothetical protein M441DRAFT_353078 [Trichoderma asperellum CBS 433.97]PTB44651.1 hypothetical protein M441DRAFT_353078 [Trichoderma asperellum CBS 433.97]